MVGGNDESRLGPIVAGPGSHAASPAASSGAASTGKGAIAESKGGDKGQEEEEEEEEDAFAGLQASLGAPKAGRAGKLALSQPSSSSNASSSRGPSAAGGTSSASAGSDTARQFDAALNEALRVPPAAAVPIRPGISLATTPAGHPAHTLSPAALKREAEDALGRMLGLLIGPHSASKAAEAAMAHRSTPEEATAAAAATGIVTSVYEEAILLLSAICTERPALVPAIARRVLRFARTPPCDVSRAPGGACHGEPVPHGTSKSHPVKAPLQEPLAQLIVQCIERLPLVQPSAAQWTREMEDALQSGKSAWPLVIGREGVASVGADEHAELAAELVAEGRKVGPIAASRAQKSMDARSRWLRAWSTGAGPSGGAGVVSRDPDGGGMVSPAVLAPDSPPLTEAPPQPGALAGPAGSAAAQIASPTGLPAGGLLG